jgi:hypothetical protein
MRAPQLRHFPRSNNQLITGIISRPVSLLLHDGQCDGGVTIDSPLGTRYITTLANDPNSSPNTAVKNIKYVSSKKTAPYTAPASFINSSSRSLLKLYFSANVLIIEI